MKLEQFQCPDSWLLIAIIEAKLAKKGSDIVDPRTKKEIGTPDAYFHHPYRALVIKACTTYNIGGFSFECPVVEGDVVLFPHTFNIAKQEFIIIENKQYLVVRYHEIRGYFTPTEEQRKKMNPLIYGGEIDENGIPLVEKTATDIKGSA